MSCIEHGLTCAFQFPECKPAESGTVAPMGGLAELRHNLPAAVERVTQLVVDNPGQFGLLVAGDIVATRVLMNLVRPRTPIEGLAVMVVLMAGLPLVAGAAVSRGWIKLRVRDEDGKLVPLEP